MNKEIVISELKLKAVRSSGAGGQNVNKVSSKVVLTFDLNSSLGLTEEEKEYLKERIATRLTQDFILMLNCDEDRSQLKNKEIVIKRFLTILTNGLKKPKIRKETRIPKSVKEKRIKEKKNIGLIKQSRRKPEI
ncbi:peptide chain release factor 1 [Flavobacterium sp. 316]|uniref:Aminoacyl-tRNA hydrolase n=1 Tax=Flavobacterium sediminilitoris TaxID=2024526 RepID=A0ABY4HPC1_9FLAO|nr:MULTISPECIES: alternative ribosome rescue aminoacyl-tRNA hydrolase ArfB [Flavobacterium]KIX21761.1 peptide chain release factor 1 [Flavobacterium sp. 316]UOX34548.1 aminoacyl-tRNA hydrolase [Flavobacterium sediminilitoris]